MAGNFLAAWRIPVKITPESLDKFNKLPAQLRLKRHSNTHSAPGNDGSLKYQLYFLTSNYLINESRCIGYCSRKPVKKEAED